MMMKMKIILFSIFLAGCGLDLSNLESSNAGHQTMESTIVGTWHGYGIGTYYELAFSDNHTLLGQYYDDDSHSLVNTGAWKLSNINNQLILMIDIFETNKVYYQSVIIEDNQIKIVDYSKK